MSDIWVKTASGTTNSAWRKAVNIFVKTASGTGSAAWSAVKSVWVFNTSWFKVWPLSGVFATSNPYIATSSGSTSGITGAVRVGTTYYGKNGTWNPNGWTITSYSYKWIYYTNSSLSDNTITSETAFATYSAPVANTISATYDKTFLSFYVRANASNTTYNGAAESATDYGKLAVVRNPPINLTKSLSSYSPAVGTQISFSSSWNTTAAYLPEASRTSIQWFRNSTNSTSGGTLISSGSYSYTPVTADIGYYIYATETTFNSGTDYDYGTTTGVSASVITTTTVTDVNYQAAGQQRRVNLPSNFTSGTTIYVSTNGYIGIGTDPSGSIFPPSSGVFLMPLQGDQRQSALWTYADSNNFYVRWQGSRYNDSTQTIDYQAKFYWNSTAVDLYFVTNNLSSSNPASTTAIYNNGSISTTWSGSTSQASSLISTGVMTRDTSKDGVDDDRTAITAAALSAPTITASVSPTTGTAGSTTYYASSTTTGNPTPTVTYSWQYFSSSSFSWVQYTTGTQFSPPSNINTLYPNYAWQMVATASNSQGSATSTVSITVNTPVSAPSGGSVSLSGGNTVGSVITASTSGWSGSPTSYDVYITTALSPNIPTSSSSRVSSSGGGSSTTYTITSSDAISPVNIFRAFATASNSAGTSGTVQSSNTITTQATPTGTAPSAPTGGGGTYSSGTNYTTNATFTRSTSGTTPITYYWSVYAGTSNGFTGGTFWNSGSFSSSTLGGTASIPQQAWNQSIYGNWARYEVYASNSIGTSGTLTWWI